MDYDYKILQAPRTGMLASAVNKELQEGYILVGQPFEFDKMFYQAVIKAAPKQQAQ